MNTRAITQVAITCTNVMGPMEHILHIVYSDDSEWIEYADKTDVISAMLTEIEKSIDKSTADECRRLLKYNLGHDSTFFVWP